MGKLDLYQNHSEYSSFRNSSGFSAPNVSVCFEEKEVHYNPIDPSYITFTPVGNDEVYVVFCAGIDNSDFGDIGIGERAGEEEEDYLYTYETSVDYGAWTPYVYGTEIELADSTHNVRFRHRMDEVDTRVWGDESFNEIYFGNGFDDNIVTHDEPIIEGGNTRKGDKINKSGLGRFYLSGGLVDCTGNIATLLDGRGASRRLDYAAFAGLFFNCENLHSAPLLPFSTLSNACYYLMFHGCTALTQSPQLNAQTIADYCYFGMFAFCYSMTTGPLQLPATVVYEHSYQYMFFDCHSLTHAPLSLPAARMDVGDIDEDSGDYNVSAGMDTIPGWFDKDDYAPVGPPIVPYESTNPILGKSGSELKREFDRILGEGESISTLYYVWKYAWYNSNNGYGSYQGTFGCYAFMFAGCSSLTQTPLLPATILGAYCYQGMFVNCKALTQVTTLPSTSITEGSYSLMFGGCDLLATAPTLPATKLNQTCYAGMFLDCVGLTSAMTILPSMTVPMGAYMLMFKNCTSLTTAPELPATMNLQEGCYAQMFNGCTSLNYIKCMVIPDISGGEITYKWVNNVASSGTFVQNSEAVWSSHGINAIPEGWNESAQTMDINYLRFSPATSQSVDMTLYSVSRWDYDVNFNAYEPGDRLYQYSINNGSWEYYSWDNGEVSKSSSNGETITLNQGDVIRFRRAFDPNGLYSDVEKGRGVEELYEIGVTGIRFGFSGGTVNASGSVCTLLEWTDSIRDLKNMDYEYNDNFGDGHFVGLFDGCGLLVSAPEIPLTSIGRYSCAYMFMGCTGLTTPPSLSAVTELSEGSCYSMFEGCTALTSVPSINVDYLPYQCYCRMFAYDLSLTSAAPITALSAEPSSCFAMYGGCTALTTPMSALPAYLVNEGNDGIGIIDDGYLAQSQNPTPKTEGDIKFDGNNTNELLFGLPTRAGDYVIGNGEFEMTSGSERNGQFSMMFCDCFNLLSAPELPAMTIDEYCYYGMFMNCASLQKAPDLPSTKLYLGCYNSMFVGCESMTSAMTSLPATTLVDYCYFGMFGECTSLTKAPKIKGRQFGDDGGGGGPKKREISYGSYRCCGFMFYNCSSLNEIEVWFGTQPAYLYNSELENWVYGVSNSGTFTYHSDDNWGTGNQSDGDYDRIPYGWTVTPPLSGGGGGGVVIK